VSRRDGEWVLSAPEVVVELAIDDPDLAQRVRALILERPEMHLADAEDDSAPDVRITDSAVGPMTDVPIVVIANRTEVLEALQAGAAAVVSERVDGAALHAAVRAAAEGLTALSSDLRYLLLGDAEAADGPEHDADTGPSQVDFTPREQQVLQLLAQGASNKVIARNLQITPHTAKFHVASIVAKLGAAGRTDAVARAMRLGLVMI
jgi:DNA-binding NarL/FixJ family response regulator